MTVMIDWLSKNKLVRHYCANKTWFYLNQPGIRERLGFFLDPGGGASLGRWLSQTFKTALDNYNVAFDAWKNPVNRTRAITITFRDAEETFIFLYRKLYLFVKNNPLATPSDLLEMGFPVYKGSHTPAPAPTSYPLASVTHPAPAVVLISFRDSDSNKRRKPAGVHGAEIIWAILDTPPQDNDWNMLIHSSFTISSPFTLTFTGPNRGKNLYFALRWENTRGAKGPWSNIRNAVIS